MKKLLCLLAMVCLLTPPVRAEELPPLPACQTVEQVEALVLYPGENNEPVAAQRGMIRYMSQDSIRDPGFCPEYWYGGEPGSELDLTLEKDRANQPYTYYARNMCTRAVYAMALSYLGIDMTPGDMSALLQERRIAAPYDDVTDRLPQLERVTFTYYIFQSMFEAYQSDSSYSPVYLYIRKPDGNTHALLVVARQENGRYIVVDPRYHEIDDEPVHVYTIALGKTSMGIVNSDFAKEHTDSVVLGFYQWRLVEQPE